MFQCSLLLILATFLCSLQTSAGSPLPLEEERPEELKFIPGARAAEYGDLETKDVGFFFRPDLLGSVKMEARGLGGRLRNKKLKKKKKKKRRPNLTTKKHMRPG